MGIPQGHPGIPGLVLGETSCRPVRSPWTLLPRAKPKMPPWGDDPHNVPAGGGALPNTQARRVVGMEHGRWQAGASG